MRNFIYVCRDCQFVDSHGDDYDSPDKCPYCKGDDWVCYENIENNDDEDGDNYSENYEEDY